jgi:hypothetical protein
MRAPSYVDLDGTPISGQSISFALQSMRDLGWRSLGNLNKFEWLCEREGFVVIYGRNCRGQRCRIVTQPQHDLHVVRFRSYQRTYMEREYRRAGERLS